ncbi:MAG: MFS transporter [Opitutales bacterium]|jgi:MFS transporter, ACS family, glucarate transporter|nr:MFS transporter [Opitutales bacterium]MDB2499560.1 MFS transporter [bacterium]MDG2169330.1 MFS transporter [Opitutales bacterium]
MNNRPTNVRWTIFVLASMTSLMLYLHRYTWAIIRPELEREYGFSNTQLEQIFTLFNFTYAFGNLPGGIVADLFGAHVFLSSIIFAWSACLIGFALAGSFWAFGGLRMIFGLTQAGAYPSLTSITKNWFPVSSRTTVQGFIAGTSGRLGGALAPIIMATILMGYFGLGWRTALIAMAGLGILFAALFYFFVRNTPKNDKRVNAAEVELIQKGETTQKAAKGIMSFKKAFSRLNYQLLLFQQYCNAGADIVYTSVLGSLFLSKDITVAEMGIYASMPLFGGAIGAFVGGVLNDVMIKLTGSRRWGRSIIGFMGKGTGAVILFFAIKQSSVAGLAWGLFCVKFFADWSLPTMIGTCTDIGGRHPATAFSVVNLTGNIGALSTPLVVGPLLDHFSTIEMINGEATRITDYNPMFMLVMALYLTSAFTWLFLDCTKPLNADKEEAA